MESMSGLSSRSTLMFTKCSFIMRAVSPSSNDSRSITWHQWHALYPTESRMGLSSSRALRRASSPHGYQSTGLFLCWSKYGLVSLASLLATASLLPPPGTACSCEHLRIARRFAPRSTLRPAAYAFSTSACQHFGLGSSLIRVRGDLEGHVILVDV